MRSRSDVPCESIARPGGSLFPVLVLALAVLAQAGPLLPARASDATSIDFNRDIRPILSGKCFICHGPDENERKGGNKRTGGLRLDTLAGQREDLGGYAAVVPGDPDSSELLKRVLTTDEDDVMPPGTDPDKRVTKAEAELLRQWIASGARFSNHWSYQVPVRPDFPPVSNASWPKNGLDRFILARLEAEGLCPQPEADRYTLARRVALDLTGLPASLEEVEVFVQDPAADAYERFVDVLLAKTSFGEHWARLWLDLARYADSAGYADDPPRTIWPYRDYVIRAFNENLPFDQFTIEQLAGDLLCEPTEEQMKATAFHRNTMTNSEGGTNDEEFRNVAIVDRVNTTFAVWMGTSMACAQCHTHKYDPITQHEYFRAFAFFNNTEDADRPDEAPLLEFYSEPLKQKRAQLDREFAAIDQQFTAPKPQLVKASEHWARVFPTTLDWRSPRPTVLKADSGTSMRLTDDTSILVDPPKDGVSKDTYTVEIPFDNPATVTALRLEALKHDSLGKNGPGHGGNFMVRRVRASVLPPQNQPGPQVRYVRIELPAKGILQLAEVEVFASGRNLAREGEATQSSTYSDAVAARANDGRTDGEYEKGSVAHTQEETQPWWEVDLKSGQAVERIVVWNRAEAGERLEGFRVVALDADRNPVWQRSANPAPKPSTTFELTGARELIFATANADVNQPNLDEALVVTESPKRPQRPGARKRRGERGWSIGEATGQDHALLMILEKPTEVPQGATLIVTIEQQGDSGKPTLGHFRLGVTRDTRAAAYAATPAGVIAALATPEADRDDAQRGVIAEHFARFVAPSLDTERQRLAELERQRDEIKPFTVPIVRELAADKRRVTQVQLRGSFLDTGDTVTEGVPAAWHAIPEGEPLNRLTLARWLMSPENPLTARVIANRFWESIFGIGIVRTSEEFGSQGELPVNQPLLDWLACELVAMKWDTKQFLKMLVTSAAYRQSSRVTPLALEKDPDNRLLSRGPRFRMAAETIRDQALAVAGLLSPKMLGPSVRPVRPNLDLRAAFGGNLDWQTSGGEDRYRRGLYTEWRRTSPYPSMTTFDAPSREVCTLRRTRSNTPLQALVTLNDPVYIEAAQGLARRMIKASDYPADRARHGFKLAVGRPAQDAEVEELLELLRDAREEFAARPDDARTFATMPLGPSEVEADHAELAAWTAVANVLLNLDETLMPR